MAAVGAITSCRAPGTSPGIGSGPASTPSPVATPPGVDGGPAPTMTLLNGRCLAVYFHRRRGGLRGRGEGILFLLRGLGGLRASYENRLPDTGRSATSWWAQAHHPRLAVWQQAKAWMPGQSLCPGLSRVPGMT